LNSYTFHISLYDLLFLGMIFVGLNFALLLAFVKSASRTANRILALALIVMVLWMARVLAIDVHLENYLPGWNRLPIRYLLALGPLIYFYVLKITRPDYKFRRRDLLHFSPLLVELSIQLLEVKESVGKGVPANTTVVFQLLNPVLQLLIFISIMVYLYQSHKLIQKFYRQLPPVLMDRSLLEFRWLRRLLAATAVLWTLWIAYAAVDYFGYRNQLGIQVYYPFYIFFAVIIIWTAAAAFLRPQAGLIVQTAGTSKLSSVPIELRQKGTWLKRAMDTNNYHQDPELSLSSLAEKLDLHPHELSRIINLALKKNFNDFVNEYRIRDVAVKMRDPAYDRITLLGMAFDAGFNSKATFIRAFKQLTGKNPAEYKRELEKEVSTYHLQPQSGARQIILVPEVPKWSHQQLNRNYMFHNYFKTAWRNILKNKFYAAINVTGLTVGLTVGLLILLWVNDEVSFDRFHTKAEQLYHVNAQLGTGSSKQIWDGVQAPIATFGLREVPEIQSAVRLVDVWGYSVFRYQDKILKPGDNGMFYTDPAFFKMFDFKLLKGDRNRPFPTNQSVIITEATAKRFFGDDNPMGKVIKADNKDNFTVSGVLADFPENSTIKADMLFSINLKAAQYSGKDFWKSMDADWGNYYTQTTIQLQPGTSVKAVEDKLTAIHIKNQPGVDASHVRYLLQPLTKMHLYKTDGSEGGMQTVRIFFIVGVLILLIACINYVNLSTARSMLRSKEVSIRKIVGAERRQLFAQFVIETTLFFIIAVVLSFIAVELLMPVYNNISGKNMQFDLLNGSVWKVIGLTIIGTLTAASIYPALLLSSFKPINALKGKLSLGVGNAMFRKALVVTQFIFSVCLIIGTIIIDNQLKYIRDKDLGYDRSQVFWFGMRDMQKNYEGARAELMSQPGVQGISTGSDIIVSASNTTGDADWDGKPANMGFLIHPMSIDKNFFSLFKLKMAEGTTFRGEAADSGHYIMNETAIREMGIKDPIGKRFKLWNKDGTIIGVVKDFNFASLKQKIEPFIFYYRPDNNWMMFVKTTGSGAAQAINAAKSQWKKYNAGFPFDYKFMDDEYDKLYKSDERSGSLLSIFAGIAIFISCLGLLGLATYTAQVKVKEIGIRKVLGASVFNITTMLSKDFLALVLLSLVIATPIAWYAMTKWLQDYQYRIGIQWWVFILAGASAILIAFITISFQAIKAALANPVKSLRSE
jgi:putative ABC transport system permease protein